MPETKQVRVLLADDSEVMRKAIARLLDASPDVSLVGQADEFHEAVQLVNELQPDIVILDLRMTAAVDADDQGLRQLCGCRTIAISASLDAEVLQLANRLNADAFLDKMKLYDELIPTIQRLGKTAD
jgi:DNA-binding NarL/FixJ family response regulator